MTKQQRKEIYWAAMFEIVAFDLDIWKAIDECVGKFTPTERVPEVRLSWGNIDDLTILSNAIDRCEQ